MKKRTIARMMAAVMAVSMLAGCGDSDGDTAKKVNLDPDHPVSLKIWHYYNTIHIVYYICLLEYH